MPPAGCGTGEGIARGRGEEQELDICAEACVMQLVAMAMDIRRSLTADQIASIPSLEPALAALDAVTRELGWHQDSPPADEPDDDTKPPLS